MRVKKAKTPARSIRYLLYADRTLQRISLRRMAVRVKKATKLSRSRRVHRNGARTPSRSRNAAPVMSAWRALGARDPWWIAFVVVCAVGVVALIGMPRSLQRSGPTRPAVQSEASQPQEEAALEPLLETARLPSRTTSRTSATRTRTANRSTGSTPAFESAKTPAVPSTANAQPMPSAAVQNAALVTVQGCLQAGGDSFWLKDTSGADAPTSRSWKSGFLKKRSASIQVVGAADAPGFSTYVGQRVAATGMLTNRTMQVHALRRVAASCN